MRLFKVNASDHFRHLWILIPIGIVLPVAVYFLMVNQFGYYKQDRALFISGITFSVCVFPLVLLHLNYYLKDRFSTFKYNSLGESVYQNGEKKIEFSNNDIDKILVFKSWPLAEERTLIFPWDSYNYAKIYLKDGTVFTISSLLVYELDKVVNIKNVTIKKTFFAWIS